MWKVTNHRQVNILVIKALVLILLLAAFSSFKKAKKEKPSETPNIIIFLADDLGYGDLGSYGHPVIMTPNLDKLAENGLKLTRCYAASPVCSPSRAGLITGKIPNRLGIYDWIPENSVMHISDSVTTIPGLLREKGYTTGLFGKWHCNGKFNSPDQPQPDDLGFDHWMATQNNAIPSHENPVNFVKNGKELGEIKGFSSQLVADEVIRWLDEQPDGQPFFGYVPFHEPHEPVASPPDLVAQYGGAINENQAQYFANVTNMDQAIGRILDKLKEQGRLENTLVIFTSDNGPETLGRYPGTSRSYGSPGNLRGMKVQLFEGGVRVPCIISWPDVITSGQESDAIVSSLDLLPTIASMVGVQLPQNEVFDGENILPLLNGDQYQRTKSLFWFYPTSVIGPNIALINGDNKLMAKTKHEYLAPGNTVGILIGSKEMDAIKTDSVSDRFHLYDLKIYGSEQQSLTEGKSILFDTLKEELKKSFYKLKTSSPYLEFE